MRGAYQMYSIVRTVEKRFGRDVNIYHQTMSNIARRLVPHDSVPLVLVVTQQRVRQPFTHRLELPGRRQPHRAERCSQTRL